MSETFRWSQPRAWVVPASILVTAGLLAGTGTNAAAFHVINQWRWMGDAWWAAISTFGDAALAMALALVLARRRPDLLWAVTLTALLAAVWVELLKFAIDLPRPSMTIDAASLHVIGPTLRRLALPSGHATAAFAAAGFAVLAFDLGGWAVVPPLAAAVVGISRIVAGAHWPIDVLVGAFGGWMASGVGLHLASAGNVWRNRAVQRAATGLSVACAVWLVVNGASHDGHPVVLSRVAGIGCLAIFLLSWRSEARLRR